MKELPKLSGQKPGNLEGSLPFGLRRLSDPPQAVKRGRPNINECNIDQGRKQSTEPLNIGPSSGAQATYK